MLNARSEKINIRIKLIIEFLSLRIISKNMHITFFSLTLIIPINIKSFRKKNDKYINFEKCISPAPFNKRIQLDSLKLVALFSYRLCRE